MPTRRWQAACQRNVQRGTIYSCWPAPLRGQPRPRRWPGTSAETVSSWPPAQEPAELVNFGESVNFPLLFGGHAGAVRGGDDGAPAAGQRVPQARRGWVAEGARVRPVSGRGGSQLAGHRGGPGRDRGRGAAGDRGRQVLWRVFATNFGVVPLTVVEALPVAALAFGVLAAANVLAFFPALLAARSRPAQLLRAE